VAVSQRSKLAITLIRSCTGHPAKHRVVVRSLGLRRLHQTVVHQDSPQIRGMINKVSHLLEVKNL
jgi:large subunit ribosomal protein L30